MTAPSWPRLAGWMATADVRTLSGRWARTDPDDGPDSAEFFFAAPDRWSHAGPQQLMAQREWDRGDYHLAAGPVVEDEHDGRACWRVEIAPPPHKAGLLVMWVDQDTHLVLKQANERFGYVEQVTDLVVDGPLPADAFAERDRAEREVARDRRLWELLQERPPPRPRHLPGRRAVRRAGLVELDDGGFVGRAPLGAEPPVSDWCDEDDVVRFDADGWSWAIGGLGEADAREVVRRVTPT